MPGLLPLVPFTRGGADLGVIEQTAELVQQRVSADEAEILESLLFVFAARSFDTSVLLAMMRRLHMSTEIIEKSAFYQEALAKGHAQGIEQGIERGKTEGLREAVWFALRGRFGTLADDMREAIARADAPILEALLLHVATESIEQVQARLGL